MRILVDLPEATLKRIQALIQEGRFSDIGVFLGAAIENQLSLERSNTRRAVVESVDVPARGAGADPFSPSDEALWKPVEATTERPRAAIPPAASLQADEAGWIWGLVNRVLPLKVSSRVVANLTKDGPVPLADLRKKASRAAARVGQWLMSMDQEDGLSRDDRLSTGFPFRSPAEKSLARYADHFVGRLTTSGEVRGGLFDLALAGVIPDGSKAVQVALTDAGWTFATLLNPVLEGGARKRGLSDEEASVYLANALRAVPRERDCLRTMLSTVAAAPTTTDRLDTVIRTRFSNRIGEAEATTLRAGALGRFLDLGLMVQSRGPGGALWAATERGREELRNIDGVA